MAEDCGILPQGKDTWDMEKGEKHWTKRRYVPRKSVATEDERVVQEAMKTKGVSGGCWNLIMQGKPPCRNASEEGFRMLEAYDLSEGFQNPVACRCRLAGAQRPQSEPCRNVLYIVHGLSPCRCTVVAGLALHFISTMGQRNVCKGAYWQKMETIKLSNSRVLSLGHCAVSAMVDGKRDNAEKFTVIAGKESYLWQEIWHMG